MENFWLIENQLKELREVHRIERNLNASYKTNAIILLDTGWNLKTVREALLLIEEPLRSYLEKFRSGGVAELVRTNYQGRANHLIFSQQAQLCDELESNIYLTTHSIIEYFREIFGVEYTPSGKRYVI